MVKLVKVEDVIAKVVYAATNPVTAGLVERVHHWPGVNTLRALLNKEPIVVKRPRHFFREDMPEEVTLTFAIPPELGDAADILARIRARVAEVEEAEAAKRARTGARVLGRRAVLRQSWSDRPRSREPRFGLRPSVACRSKWARIEALQRNRDFVAAYLDARDLWRVGRPAIFPPGTYWLRRHAPITVASDPFAAPIRDPVLN